MRACIVGVCSILAVVAASQSGCTDSGTSGASATIVGPPGGGGPSDEPGPAHPTVPGISRVAAANVIASGVSDGGGGGVVDTDGGGGVDAAPTPDAGLPDVAADGGICGAGLAANSTCTCNASCAADCPGGGCGATCANSATCEYTCSGANCTFGCAAGAFCSATCAGGGCTFRCASGSTCTNDCGGGRCTFQCESGSNCLNTCSAGNCTGQ
jgi:hypothetical protein